MGIDTAAPWREVRANEVRNLSLKGEGTGATVHHGYLPARDPDDKPIPVALRKPRITSSLALQRFDDELALRSHLQHPNILPLLAACSKPPQYCTISPWMSGGNLFDLIHSRSVNMSFERLLRLSVQLADGMAYLHRSHLVHRDLKTANVLLDGTWENLVVADLDLAIDVNALRTAATKNNGRALHRGPSNGRLSHMVGTLVYMPPEVLSGSPHSFAADVYAFAITVNEMAAAAVPFVDRKMPVPELHTVLETRFNEVRLRSAIVKDHLRPVLASGVSDEFKLLIEQCWHSDPVERPSFQEILSTLNTMLTKGSDYLSQYPGTTLASQLNGHAKGIGSEDGESLMKQIKHNNDNPQSPVWEKVFALKKPSCEPLRVSAGLSSTYGERGMDCMEDRNLVEPNLADLPSTHLFAVFDGHAGQACSDFAARYFPGTLSRAWVVEEATPESALIHAFEDIDNAFLETMPQDENSGCTALAALLVGTALYVANAGDCRCVLGKKDGTALPLSKDHVATDPQERARIAARGGFVSVTGRVQGSLMVSRAIGDRAYKRYVSATPEVLTRELTDEDDFLILASDGLWDVVSNEDAVSMVISTVRVPDMAAKRLALKAIELGSDDNISVIVVFLRGEVSFSQI